MKNKLIKLFNKYKELILYGIFGVITVIINLILYKLFLDLKIHYVISSLISYIIASLISYFFNTYFVFHSEKLNIKGELIRITKYFVVRIWSVIVDTLLLMFAVEVLKLDEFYAKPIVSVVVITMTFILNKKILKKKK